MGIIEKIKNGFPVSLGKSVAWLGGFGPDATFHRIEEEYLADRRNRDGRRANFRTVFPRVARIPCAGSVAKGIYALGTGNVLSLLAVLLVFTAIKAPFFGLPFTGEHSMKYNAYVEPALHMSQAGTPLLYQKKYLANPVTNPEGIYSAFPHLPLFEWGLYATYETMPFVSLEMKTRVFTHLIGMGILLSAFLFFVRWLPENMAAMAMLFMGINPIILFGTFVTVLDSLAILLMFISFLSLEKYLDEGRASSLFWAGIAYGIGISVKISLILWMAPISILLIRSKRVEVVPLLRDFLVYTVLGVLVIATHMTSIRNMINAPGISMAALAAWMIFYWGLFRTLGKGMDSMTAWIGRAWRKKVLMIPAAAGLLLLGIIAFRYFKYDRFGRDFLTDLSLLFNYRLYKYMLFSQFKNYMTRSIFWLGISGFLLVFAIGSTRCRNLVLAFSAGSVVYWVIASKAMFFHNYYTLIIMILFSLSAAIISYYLCLNMPNAAAKGVISILFAALIFPPAHDEALAKVGWHDPVTEVVRFIRDNTDKKDFIMYDGWLSPLVIYTGRGFVKPVEIAGEEIREEIRRLGFAATMNKYRIRYFFTVNENPSYGNIAPLFARTRLREPDGGNYDRNLSIFREIGQRDPETDDALREIERVKIEYGLAGKFKPAANFGKYRFYTFQN